MIELKRKVVQLLNRKPNKHSEEFKKFKELTNFYHKKPEQCVESINDTQTLVKACALLQKALTGPTLPQKKKKSPNFNRRPKNNNRHTMHTETLRKMNYNDFLRSDHWNQTKESARILGLYKQCYCCGVTREKLDLHHITYRHRGTKQERRDCKGLVAVCKRCHSAIHNYEDEYKVSIRVATAVIKNNA